MAAVLFPSNPTVGQVFTVGNLSYIWDGEKWIFATAEGGGGGGVGGVTSITAGAGLSGGTITSSGIIALQTPVSVADGGTGETSLDDLRNSLGVTPTYVGTTAPPNPTIGTLWFSTTLGMLMVWTGSAWVVSSGGTWAPQTNPAGGQNNYSPINNPAFTGAATLNGVPLSTDTGNMGVTDGSNAIAGAIGEYLTSSFSLTPAMNNYVPFGSLAISAGDWQANASVQFISNSASQSYTSFICMLYNRNDGENPPPQGSTGYIQSGGTNTYMPTYAPFMLGPTRFSTASAMTVYVTGMITGVIGGTIQGQIVARRMR
jgi:hypothetical protein